MAVPSKNEKLLQWFLDLINLDAEALDSGDRMKWITEVLYLLHFGEPTIKSQSLPSLKKTEAHKRISKWDTGSEFEDCLAFLKDKVDGMMTKIQRRLNSVVKSHTDRRRDPTLAEIEMPVVIQVKIPAFYTKSFLDEEFHIDIGADTDQDELFLQLCLALKGVKIGAIKTCQECGNYFLQTTKMKKKFCTNKCAARNASRAKRQWIKKYDKPRYDEYNKKGKDRANESYRNRKANGKPAKQPRKHKDSTEA